MNPRKIVFSRKQGAKPPVGLRHGSTVKPATAQPKTATAAAPPVYRPQAASKAVQSKAAITAQGQPPPKAPPVYRPQAAPKVLQAKMPDARAQPNQPSRRPAAPPVYRPEPKRVVQPKAAATAPSANTPKAPPVYRPQQPLVLQPKSVPGKPPDRQKTQATNPPPATRAAVVQRRAATPAPGQRPATAPPAAPPGPARPSPPHGRRGVLQLLPVSELKVALAQDKTFATNYDPWIKHKLAVTGLAQEKIIEKFSLSQLKDSAAEFATHQRNRQTVVEAIWEDVSFFASLVTDKVSHAQQTVSDYYSSQVPATLLKSATLKNAAGAKLAGGLEKLKQKFNAAIKVMDAEAFDKRRVREAKERGLAVEDELLDMDYSLGFRVGDEFYLRLGSGTPGEDLHTPIHEFMHSLSSVLAKTLLGSTLNEGLTERITLKVMEEAGKPCARPSYAGERAEVENLIKFLKGRGITEQDLYYAYFNLSIMGGSVGGLVPAVERFKELSGIAASTVKLECEQKNIAFDGSRWSASFAYKDAKLQQLEDANASKTFWGLIREVAFGGAEVYKQLPNLAPAKGF